MATQFDADLDRLADLTDDELNALEGQITDAFQSADDSGDDAAMTDLADALDRVRTERDRRSSAPQVNPGEAAAAPVAEVAAAVETEPPPTPPATAPPPPEASTANPGQTTDPREEPTVASGEIEVPRGRAPVVVEPGNVIVAGADIPGYSAGTVFSDYDQMCQAMTSRINTVMRMGGDGEKVVIASIQSPAPEERMLHRGDLGGNREKISNVTDYSALVAAGGCCAPLTTRYDLFGIGDTDRPVRDALAGFQADRGGIRYFTPPTLDELAGAVGFWTCDDDEAAAIDPPGPTKVCIRIDCPPEKEAIIQAVTLCITFGVMQSRVFPELVAVNNQLSTVAQARVADSSLLAQIKAGSTAMAGGAAVYGCTRDLLLTLGQAAAYLRDRNRLRNDHPMRAVLPSWLMDALRSDLLLNPHSTADLPDNYGISAAEINQFFTDRSINPTWALDSAAPATNGGGYYAKATSTIPKFPANLEFALFPEGSWLFLDGGSLDLGVVRDASLVRTNDYMQFSETFEAATNIGAESWWVTQPISVLGKAACCTDGPAGP